MTARTVPASPNFFAGQKLTGTVMNQISTVQNFWSSPPMFSMHQASAQSVANSTYAQITMDTSDWDTDAGRAGTTPWSYVIPAGMTGRWEFTAHVAWGTNSAGNRLLAIYKNGTIFSESEVSEPTTSSANFCELQTTLTMSVNAGDVMSVWSFQASGASLSTAAGLSFFEGRLVSLATP